MNHSAYSCARFPASVFAFAAAFVFSTVIVFKLGVDMGFGDVSDGDDDRVHKGSVRDHDGDMRHAQRTSVIFRVNHVGTGSTSLTTSRSSWACSFYKKGSVGGHRRKK